MAPRPVVHRHPDDGMELAGPDAGERADGACAAHAGDAIIPDGPRTDDTFETVR